MKKVVVAIAFGLSSAMACAPAQNPVVSVPTPLPAKCTSCHLAPKPRSLEEARWAAFLKAHQRRLRLSDADKKLLHGYLVGDPPSPPPDGSF